MVTAWIIDTYSFTTEYSSKNLHNNYLFPSAGRSGTHMPVRPLILSKMPPIVVRALRDDPADLLVRAGGGQRWRALRALRALFSMTLDQRQNN